MRRIIIGFALTALVVARPELYKEKEDFQYSRSSSDEGTKSGFYGSQRGNMGGNFERAHNMDSFAQNQMGGAIRQVEGELGDVAKTRSGSVYTAANSRGFFGSGHYDLSNLGGRNFQEGESYGHDQSHSSGSNMNSEAHSSSQNSARFSSSQFGNSDRSRYYSGAQAAENVQSSGQYERASQSDHNSKFYLQQSGHLDQNLYRQSNLNHDASHADDANTHHRLVSTVPVKIIVRPGQTIAVPIATETRDGSTIDSYYNQNKANRETELVDTEAQQTNFKPISQGKNYESSYSYRKQWEKHDSRPEIIPLSVPTVDSLRENSESNVDTEKFRQNMHQYIETGERNTAASQLRHQADYNSHRSSANYNSNAFSEENRQRSGMNSHSGNIVDEFANKPLSYQSSYSYHKSWERQGDPYVIKPASNGAYGDQTSQRLTDGTQFSSYDSTRAKSHQRYATTNCVYECEPAHSRVARSYAATQAQFEQQSQNLEDLGQQTQNNWENLEDLRQQTQQWNRYQDMGQQMQNKFDNLEDLGQQTQNKFDNLEDLGQQTQNKFDNLEEFGQQTQNKFDNLEYLGQQTQHKWAESQNLGQQTQTSLNGLQDFGQTQDKNLHLEDFGAQSQNKLENVEDLGQQTQNKWDSAQNFEQQTQNKNLHLEDLGQQTETKWDFDQSQKNSDQETENMWNQFNQDAENKWDSPNAREQIEDEQAQYGDQQTQNKYENVNEFKNWEHTQSEMEGDGQEIQTDWDSPLSQKTQYKINLDDLGQQTESKWDSQQQFNSEQISDTFVPSSSYDQGQETQELLSQLEKSGDKHTENNQNINFPEVQGFSDQQNVPLNKHPWDNIGNFGQEQKGDSYETSLFPDSNWNSKPTQTSLDPFKNLWGKIDNLGGDDPIDNENPGYVKNDFSLHSSSEKHDQTLYKEGFQQTSSGSLLGNNNVVWDKVLPLPTRKQPDTTIKTSEYTDSLELTTETRYTQINHEISTSSTTEKNIKNNSFQPVDIGRGDIGPEDELKDDNVEHIVEISSTTNKPEEKSTITEIPMEEPIYYHNVDQHSSHYLSNDTQEQNNLQQSIANNQEQTNLHNSNFETEYHKNKFALGEHHLIDIEQVNFEAQKNQPLSNIENQSDENQFKHWTFENQNQENQFKHWTFENHNQENQFKHWTFENQNQENQFKHWTFENEYQENQFKHWTFENQNHENQFQHWTFENKNQENLAKRVADFAQENENVYDNTYRNLEQQNKGDIFTKWNIEQPITENVDQKNEMQHSSNMNEYNQQNMDKDFTDDAVQVNINRNSKIEKWESQDKSADNEPNLLSDEGYIQNEKIERIGQYGMHDVSPVEDTQKKVSSSPILEENKQNDILSPPEIVNAPEVSTDKPGFWKSISNKFKNTKDKISSWFSS